MAVILIFCVVIAVLVYKNKQYKEGAYYQITRNTYSSIKYDKGRYAEYLIYKSLRHLEDSRSKFLFNILIPKGNGETTEIDVLLICPKGLFVFESKNYSGWIFGNEAHKNWTQTLPKGRGRSHKERFYNPVMQNASHIKHLQALISENTPVHSIIVFSDRCTLKDITLKSKDVSVINRYKVAPTIIQLYNQIQKNFYTETQIQDIYRNYPYTQLGHELKALHIERIKRNKGFI